LKYYRDIEIKSSEPLWVEPAIQILKYYEDIKIKPPETLWVRGSN
jgi:hypothetical protein